MSATDKTALLKQLRSYLPARLQNRLEDANTILKHITWLRNMLTTFLPRYLLKLVAEGSELGQVNDVFRYGTVMFADIAGFTAMSEQLSKLGKEGAEEVTSIVNEYFDIMLTISAYNGGDLLKFGGDALLLFFEGEEGPYQAIFTAQAMQQAMGRFARVLTSRGTFSLEMSIGLGTGLIFLAHLPSDERVEYAVMGPALAKMAQAEALATARQIIVDQATHDIIEDLAVFSSAEDDFWLLKSLSPTNGSLAVYSQPWEAFEPPTGSSPEKMLNLLLPHLDAIESMRPFVSEEIFSRLIADPQRPLPGSHRPVTVMFANFYGVNPIVEALGPQHQRAVSQILNLHFSAMSRIINRYGGLINKVDSYAIGYRIMALFGALQVHEDDPQRAVHAALEMNQALSEVNHETLELLNTLDLGIDWDEKLLKQRIGINTGFVFAGNIGSLIRREYTVMGNQVNLTARLMGVAPEGQVLISQSTAHHVQNAFNLSERAPVMVKGQSQPVRNYVVTGLRERSIQWSRIAAGPLVDRIEALKTGKATAERTRVGNGTLLLISGAPGIGKTRLAEEIVLYGQSLGMQLLAGTCLSYGQTMTYHPWADVFRAFFGIQPDDSPAARLEAIQQGLDEIDAGEWTPIIADVLGLDFPDNELTGALDAKLRRQRLFDLTVKLLQTRTKARPLMLVIEDAQRADPASMDLIDYVARNIADYPVLFILPHRPNERLPDWTVHPHATSLSLGELTNEDCLEIVKGMIGSVALPSSLTQIILDKSDGNPFFVEEVVRALIDAKALQQRADRQWELAQEIGTIELPDTIHGIIISRIDRLLETDRRVLQVASVVGRVFSRRLLDGAYPYGALEGTLTRRLDHLGGLGLTEIQSLEEELYRFRHATTWDVVYGSQAFEQRRNLHRRIANFIEIEYTDSPGERTELLAYHYWEGHSWAKAMDFNLLAGQRAQREFANDTAVTAYQRALEAAAKLDEDTSAHRLQAHESLGEVLTLLGQYDQALEHYQDALSLTDDDRCRTDICRKTADVFERRGEYDTAFEWLEKGLSYLDSDKPSIESARIFLLGAGVYHRQSKYDDAIDWCQQSLSAAEKLHTRDGKQTIAQAYYLLGAIHRRQGDLHRTVEFCQQSIQVYQDIDDIVGLSQAYINLSNAYSDLGDWDRGSEALRQSLEMKERIGDVLYQGIIANNLAQLELDRGDWEQAGALFEQSYAIWNQVGATAFKGVTLSNLAQVHIYQGYWDKARHCLQQSQTIFAQVGTEEYLPELERRWAEFHIHTLELELALEHAQRSVELAAAQEARLEEGLSYRTLGQVYLARNERDLAQSTLQQSLEILQSLDSEFEAARAAVSLAQSEIQVDPDAAGKRLESAIQIFEKLGAQADLATARSIKKQLS